MADLAQARAEAQRRLQAKFEDIFQRYGQAFDDQCDEIDLSTGELVVDRGFLQNMDIVTFGRIVSTTAVKDIPSIGKKRRLCLVSNDSDDELPIFTSPTQPRRRSFYTPQKSVGRSTTTSDTPVRQVLEPVSRSAPVTPEHTIGLCVLIPDINDHTSVIKPLDGSTPHGGDWCHITNADSDATDSDTDTALSTAFTEVIASTRHKWHQSTYKTPVSGPASPSTPPPEVIQVALPPPSFPPPPCSVSPRSPTGTSQPSFLSTPVTQPRVLTATSAPRPSTQTSAFLATPTRSNKKAKVNPFQDHQLNMSVVTQTPGRFPRKSDHTAAEGSPDPLCLGPGICQKIFCFTCARSQN
ncbi:hypothetical protein IWQ61_002097 [Dispira simplex]|nr:hypothetical protein IWQ61_002097 [Dispira simplex]